MEYKERPGCSNLTLAIISLLADEIRVGTAAFRLLKDKVPPSFLSLFLSPPLTCPLVSLLLYPMGRVSRCEVIRREERRASCMTITERS